MEDKTFKQAIEQLTERLKKEYREAFLKSVGDVNKGKTAREAVQWIDDESMRAHILSSLLQLRLHALLSTARDEGWITDEALQELAAYLALPQSE